MQQPTASNPSPRRPLRPLRISPLWRGFAEALGAMLALLAFGLCWAGVESLDRVREREMPRSSWVRANAAAEQLSALQRMESRLPAEARQPSGWSRPVAHLSSPADVAFAPDNFALDAWRLAADGG